ncbi:uncharacterized protein LOC110759855 [Prunus avium]|uniref:Uncharacterized protein LOC110759855 n=1 Tax=Prunus avium TaxID=42229 RepID=A0A6P5SNJ1_PRUAV|nr:uncharacterized protein LOC110759855 [Prunus avium]
MASSVKGSIPKSENAKQYYEAIAQRFKESKKAIKSTLLNQLINMRYDGQGCVRAHIMNMIDVGTKLQDLEMNEHNITRERGARMVNLVQSKQNKEYRNKGTAAGKEKEKEKDNNSPNALKPVGLKCFFCKKTEHMKKKCKRYKKWLDKQKTKGKTDQVLGFIKRRLPNKDEVKVFVGNGDKVQVDYIGVVRIKLDSGFVFDLEDVVYVPSMRKNLISITRLVKSKFTLNFDDFGCSIFRNKSLVGKASIVDGLKFGICPVYRGDSAKFFW